MPDAHNVDAWIRWEYNRLNAGLVTRTKSLRALLDEPTPRLTSKDGDAVFVDRDVLQRIAAVCSPEERPKLRLPITLHFSADAEDSAYVTNDLAAAVLHRLEGWGEAYPYREGKMWLPASLAVELLLRYGGALQRLML